MQPHKCQLLQQKKVNALVAPSIISSLIRDSMLDETLAISIRKRNWQFTVEMCAKSTFDRFLSNHFFVQRNEHFCRFDYAMCNFMSRHFNSPVKLAPLLNTHRKKGRKPKEAALLCAHSYTFDRVRANRHHANTQTQISLRSIKFPFEIQTNKNELFRVEVRECEANGTQRNEWIFEFLIMKICYHFRNNCFFFTSFSSFVRFGSVDEQTWMRSVSVSEIDIHFMLHALVISSEVFHRRMDNVLSLRVRTVKYRQLTPLILNFVILPLLSFAWHRCHAHSLSLYFFILCIQSILNL